MVQNCLSQLSPNASYVRAVGNRTLLGAGDRGMDMSALKLYVVGRKGLDLTQNVSDLIAEFTDGFYGKPAGVHVRRYINVLGDSMLRFGAALPPSTNPNGGGPAAVNAGWEYSPVLANDTFMTAADAMAQATRAAAQSGVAAHMERMGEAWVPCQFIALVRWQKLRAFAAENRRLTWPFSSTASSRLSRKSR